MHLPPMFATFIFLGIAIAGVAKGPSAPDTLVADSHQPLSDTPARPPSHGPHHNPPTGSGGHHAANLVRDTLAARYETRLGASGHGDHGNVPRSLPPKQKPNKPKQQPQNTSPAQKPPVKSPPRQPPKESPKKPHTLISERALDPIFPGADRTDDDEPNLPFPRAERPKDVLDKPPVHSQAPPSGSRNNPASAPDPKLQPPKEHGQKRHAFISEQVDQASPADSVSPGTDDVLGDDHVHGHVLRARSQKPPVKGHEKPPTEYPTPTDPSQEPPKSPKPPVNQHGKHSRNVTPEQDLVDKVAV